MGKKETQKNIPHTGLPHVFLWPNPANGVERRRSIAIILTTRSQETLFFYACPVTSRSITRDTQQVRQNKIHCRRSSRRSGDRAAAQKQIEKWRVKIKGVSGEEAAPRHGAELRDYRALGQGHGSGVSPWPQTMMSPIWI